MYRGILLFAAYTTLLLLIHPFLVGSQTLHPAKNHNNDCALSCGSINIAPPFRLQGDRQDCGNKRYELSCETNITVLYLYSGKYYVQEINYDNFTVRLVDSGVQNINYNFSNPLHSLTSFNFSYEDSYSYPDQYRYAEPTVPIIFLSCANPVNSSLFVEAAPCIMNKNSLRRDSNSYFIVGSIRPAALVDSCKITLMVSSSVSITKHPTMSCQGLYDELVHGFELSWFNYGCGICGKHEICSRNRNLNKTDIYSCFEIKGPWYRTIQIKIERMLITNYIIYPDEFLIRPILSALAYFVLFQAAKLLFGSPFVIALLIYKCRRRHLSMYENIEDFLQSNNNLMPVRYSYADIKKMARGFKDKLGAGGYGTVYKAKLRSGHLVAIKMLGKFRANGQEFINEVATIGRIHHVNVVQLIGFCVDGSNRALIYEFMPNGSLEKYIFSQPGPEVIFLSCEKIFEIALGVARGIDYLHRGCDMQILHFDIKPHNILLDENFTPKVSDFGLARLNPLDNSMVPMTAARGTIGYIAPELFYKNIGGISYKADVYSFGMLLMEMAGRRKNLDSTVEDSSECSQMYFPTWVSDQLTEGKHIEIGDATEEEMKIIRKMIIVALWCIQMKPSERPSMNEVVEMLEGKI
ncbi:hypothetical protein ACLB2K_055927 [Fragaria x ananassa]